MREKWEKLRFLIIPPDAPDYVVEQHRDIFFMGAWSALQNAKLMFESDKWKYPVEEVTDNFIKTYAEIYRYIFKSFFDENDEPKEDIDKIYKNVNDSAMAKLEKQLQEHKEREK